MNMNVFVLQHAAKLSSTICRPSLHTSVIVRLSSV